MINSDSMKVFRIAERLTVPQLVMAIKRGTVDPVIGQLVLNNKVQQQKKMAQAQAAQRPERPPVAQENMMSGIAQMPVREEMYPDDAFASGGIVGYAEGGAIMDDSRRPAMGEGVLETPIGQFLHNLQFEDLTEGPARARKTAERREGLREGLKNAGKALMGIPLLDALRTKVIDRPGMSVANAAPMSMDDVRTAPRNLPERSAGTGAPKEAPTSESAKISRAIEASAGIPGVAPRSNVEFKSADDVKATRGDRAERLSATSKAREKELADGDKDAYKGIKDILEDQKGRMSKSDKQNLWLSLMKAGLAAAGGDSQYALQNIARGGEAGLENYVQQNLINRSQQQQLARDEQAMRLNELGQAKENRSLADKYAQTIAGLEQGDQALALP